MRRGALREMSEGDRYRLLLGGITDYAIYMLDAQGHVSSWNPGAERFKGYRAAEILGEHFSRFHTPEDRAAGLPDRALATAESEGRFEGEGWRVRKDGTRFWAHVVIDPIRAAGGELIGFAKITRDLTERREAQQALERAQEGLLQARKLEALGQLAGGVAHDFNNLLMAISGSLDLLDRRIARDDAHVARLIGGARRAVDRGTSLTARMLAFSRRQPIERRPVDVALLLEGLEGLIRLTVGDGVVLETDLPPGLPPALTDPGQLELAVINVAANARDAMPGGGRLRITAALADLRAGEAPDLGPGRFLRLTLEDDGQGMDAATLRRAADPFFTTKGPGRGTGLGLSVVHGFLRDSGGRLALRSQAGEGTTVELWLPEAPPADPADPGDGEGADGGEPLPALAVLAVDDDELVLEATVGLLKELGLLPIPARGGAEALERLGQGGVDLVVTDHGMPGMTGAELAARIRRSHPGLPVILVTGYLDRGAPALPPDLPRLDKPFDLVALSRAVRDATAAARAWTP